ncbi:restriction endonuclease subunit S [Bacillus sp. 1P02SD]|uniref:restriction endonuclease subunit S n=1 Tax=Bacillus sp. 1P02SD TaxID=3132264 RepID=UPI0039A1FF5B
MSKWENVKLGEVCIIERGGSPRPISSFITDEPNGINWIKIGDAESNSMYINSTKEKIKPEGMKKSRFVKKGDFILSNSMSFGRPYILNIDGCIHDGWLLIRDSNSSFEKRFLYYALSSPFVKRQFIKAAVGGVVNNLNSELVRKTKVPMPPKDAQKEIANTLDKTQEIIEIHKKQLQELDNLVEATFYDLFGDLVINDKKWKITTVEKVCENIFGGGTPSKSKPEYYVGDIPWVTPKDMKTIFISDSIDHINEDAISNSSAKLIPSNSILMVIRSGILKRKLPVAINKVPVAVNQDMKAFVVNNTIKSEYLLYYFIMTQMNFLKNVRSVTADNIEFNLIKNAILPLPPPELQDKFAEIVSKIEEQKDIVKQSIIESQNLFNSLMSKYFD